MMTDIVKRLRVGFRGQGLTRAIRRKEDEPYPGEPYMSMDDAMPLLNEAADEIERQNAENQINFERLCAAKDENAKLREALEKIANTNGTILYHGGLISEPPQDRMKQIARAALQKDERE